MLKKSFFLFSVVIVAVFALVFVTKIVIAEAARPAVCAAPIAADNYSPAVTPRCCNINGVAPACPVKNISGYERCDGIAEEGRSICATSLGITSGKWAGKCIFGM
jgi:hypothetical protein